MGFLLSYVSPAIFVLSAVLGRATGDADLFAALPVIVALAVAPLLSMLGVNWDEPAPVRPASSASRRFYRFLPFGAVPAQLIALGVAAEYWATAPLTFVGRVAWLLSTGVFGALYAITVAHELIHQRGRLDRTLGGILLSTVCFGTFKVVHLRVHHRFVGTSRDFASADKGASIYRFWLGALTGNVREALRCERKRLGALRRPWWHSELVAWYAASLLWLGLAVLMWGWMGGVFFVLQGLLAIMALDWTNYVQHYGLRRAMTSDGRHERVQPHHAWSMQCRISNLALLNLLRHGDHHAHPQVPYHALQHSTMPVYPLPFGFMMLLALVTPLFRLVVDPLLDRVSVEA